MFLFVFAGAKRSGEIAKFQFLIPANGGVATFSQKVPESAGDSGVFLYFVVLSLAFELDMDIQIYDQG